MKFSIVQIQEFRKDFTIASWLQHCIGVTFEEAVQRVIATQKANSNKLNLALVPECHAGYNMFIPNENILQLFLPDDPEFAKLGRILNYSAT